MVLVRLTVVTINWFSHIYAYLSATCYHGRSSGLTSSNNRGNAFLSFYKSLKM